jgi:hypothetical protein
MSKVGDATSIEIGELVLEICKQLADGDSFGIGLDPFGDDWEATFFSCGGNDDQGCVVEQCVQPSLVAALRGLLGSVSGREGTNGL